jgi:hypothetical protein
MLRCTCLRLASRPVCLVTLQTHRWLWSLQGRVGRSASVAALGDGKHSAQAATVLLPVLRVRHPALTRAERCVTMVLAAFLLLLNIEHARRLHLVSASALALRKSWQAERQNACLRRTAWRG